MSERRPFRKFKKREPVLTIEQKIQEFILRNSNNGFFTKVSTIPYKFEISESRAWDVVGELLVDGVLESSHNVATGEMKLCATGQTYAIMDLERKRKREKPGSFRRNNNNNKRTKITEGGRSFPPGSQGNKTKKEKISRERK